MCPGACWTPYTARRGPEMITDKARRVLHALGIPDECSGAFATSYLAAEGPLIPTEDPSTGALLGRVRGGSPAEYDVIVEAARARFLEWRMRPAPERGAVIRRLAELLREYKKPLAEL